MESQPQNPEFRINPENLHPAFTCIYNGQIELPLESPENDFHSYRYQCIYVDLGRFVLHPL